MIRFLPVSEVAQLGTGRRKRVIAFKSVHPSSANTGSNSRFSIQFWNLGLEKGPARSNVNFSNQNVRK